jgi:hypothetical protein
VRRLSRTMVLMELPHLRVPRTKFANCLSHRVKEKSVNDMGDPPGSEAKTLRAVGASGGQARRSPSRGMRWPAAPLLRALLFAGNERDGRVLFELERTRVHEVRGIGGSALWRKCHSHRSVQVNAKDVREKEGEDNMRSDSWGDVRGHI